MESYFCQKKAQTQPSASFYVCTLPRRNWRVWHWVRISCAAHPLLHCSGTIILGNRALFGPAISNLKPALKNKRIRSPTGALERTHSRSHAFRHAILTTARAHAIYDYCACAAFAIAVYTTSGDLPTPRYIMRWRFLS